MNLQQNLNDIDEERMTAVKEIDDVSAALKAGKNEYIEKKVRYETERVQRDRQEKTRIEEERGAEG